jgi:hypothetical protein
MLCGVCAALAACTGFGKHPHAEAGGQTHPGTGGTHGQGLVASVIAWLVALVCENAALLFLASFNSIKMYITLQVWNAPCQAHWAASLPLTGNQPAIWPTWAIAAVMRG